MPDFQNYVLTPLGKASVSVPRAQIEAQITDSTTGALLADFTGANALLFPAVWGDLTAAQRLELGELLAHRILLLKAGLA